MIAILLAVLLQSPADLAAFLASIEKDRAAGATAEALVQKIDAWAQGKPDAVRARLAWNRALHQATARVDALFMEGLKQRVGKQVAIGRSSGVLKEVKADRIVLGVPGGTMEVELSSIAFDVRLADVKKQELLPARNAEEAIFRFAAGRAISAIEAAKALPAEDQARALGAMAGWVLQEADKSPLLKTAEDFAATWSKHPELLAAGGGVLRAFIDADLAPKLVDESDAVLAQDRKTARKLLDLAASLCKADEIVKKVSERRWSVLEKGEWMSIPLDTLKFDEGVLKGTAVAFEDKNPEKEKVSGLGLESAGIPWEEIAGVRCQIKPIKGDHIDMRFKFGDARQISIAIGLKDGIAFCVQYDDAKAKGTAEPKKVSKKGAAYELTAAWEGKKWKFSVGGTEIETIYAPAAVPDRMSFVANNGAAELLSLHIRKK
jgi:hypothetical protein